MEAAPAWFIERLVPPPALVADVAPVRRTAHPRGAAPVAHHPREPRLVHHQSNPPVGQSARGRGAAREPAAAAGVEPHIELRAAGPHRRLTAGTCAAGPGGAEPGDYPVVQKNLGHASVGTTSMYLTTETDERMKAMRGFWKPVNSRASVQF